MTFWRLLVRNTGYPLAAAFLAVSACGLVFDLKRMVEGQRHPATLALGTATIAATALFYAAHRRLRRSFRGDL